MSARNELPFDRGFRHGLAVYRDRLLTYVRFIGVTLVVFSPVLIAIYMRALFAMFFGIYVLFLLWSLTSYAYLWAFRLYGDILILQYLRAAAAEAIKRGDVDRARALLEGTR